MLNTYLKVVLSSALLLSVVTSFSEKASTSTSVPEPSTNIAIFGFGLGWLLKRKFNRSIGGIRRISGS